MTDDVKTDTSAPAAAPAPAPAPAADPAPAAVDNSHIADPAERARANGYVEPEAPSHDDRVKALVGYVEHAHKHNSPMSKHMIREMKDLLGYQDEPKPDAA